MPRLSRRLRAAIALEVALIAAYVIVVLLLTPH